MAMNFRGAAFVGEFGELTGYKSGLALGEDRFREIFAAGGYERFWPEHPDVWLRIHSEEFEEMFAFTLAQLGVGPSVHVVTPIGFVYHRVKNDPEKLEMFYELSDLFIQHLDSALKQKESKTIALRPFVAEAESRFGAPGLEIALMITEATIAHQIQSPWSVTRRVDWENVRDLDELFTSEHLESPHGEYFDERFANFLSMNFEKVGAINWRQFEGLAAEFFKGEGYEVELGPGRNDDGVDIRLRTLDEEGGPAVILVQCKRQKDKIDKTIVKALWADVVAEGAESGVIVTTSSISPGAAAVRTARGYPVEEVDRERVRDFVDALKTPGTGIYLAE